MQSEVNQTEIAHRLTDGRCGVFNGREAVMDRSTRREGNTQPWTARNSAPKGGA